MFFTSPEVVRSVVSPNKYKKERDSAIAAAAKPWYTGTAFTCDSATICKVPRVQAPMFNAFTNTPNEGDERSFVTASVAPRISLLGQNPSQSFYVNTLEVKPGDEVRVRVYFRNSACVAKCVWDERSITQNARVGIFVPTGSAAGHTILAVLYADNASPSRIADRVAVVSDEPIRLEPVEEGARLINDYSGGYTKNKAVSGVGTRLSPDAVGESSEIDNDPSRFGRNDGVRLGYNTLDGRLRPGFVDMGYVLARLRVRAG